MRTVFTALFLLSLSWLIASPIPQVPSTIEIAGVKLKLTNEAQREIQNDVNALRASDKYFRIKLDRVNLYFPIIERVLKEEGVPEVLKYLAVQESALVSDAVSSANAVGYWQFKDFTAREVGLRVDSKIDERKNIVSATKGAAKYFKMNNFYFKNWIYSISAYQAGRGGASKYVDKENFGSDKLTITKKTHWYVLRFIAHVIAFQDEVGGGHSEGLKLGEYTKGEGKSIEQIANEHKLDVNLVKDYNKWLQHGRIPDDKVYTVILPTTGKLPKSKDSEDQPPLTRTIESPEEKTIYPDELGISKELKTIFIRLNGLSAVMAGKEDNVVKLALKSGISSAQLIKYNDLKPTQTIKTGEIYYTRSKRGRSPVRFHTAQPGETLWSISQKYGIKLKSLAKKNRMEENEILKAGRVLWMGKTRPKSTAIEYRKVVPKRASEPSKVSKPITKKEIAPEPITTTKPTPAQEVTPEPKTVVEIKESNQSNDETKSDSELTHIVEAGESLWSIAQRYGIGLDELRKMNDLTAESVLSIGQQLLTTLTDADNIQPEEPEENELPTTTKFHEVQSGESLWAISRKYGVTVDDLREWNGLNTKSTLNPGQKLMLQGDKDGGRKTDKFKFYTVKAGDSLYKISKDFDVSVRDIQLWNDMDDSTLSVGQVIKIKKN
ncbi:MAG: LysM peptidoglycan-binding domain-containing protein [Cyclobacteriaceae bacterium]